MTLPPRSLIPFAQVRDVNASIAFYRLVGLEVGNTFTPQDESEPAWAWLRSERAQLMVGCADEPFEPPKQGIFFYLYVDDVEAKRAELVAAGIDAGPVACPFYAPRGEFRIVDPDGYVLMITHT